MTCVVQFPSPDTVASPLPLLSFFPHLPLSHRSAPIATPNLHTPTPPPSPNRSPFSLHPHQRRVSCAKPSFNPYQPVRRRPFFFSFPSFFFFSSLFSFLSLPLSLSFFSLSFPLSSSFFLPENLSPFKPEKHGQPLLSLRIDTRGGGVKILGHLFSTSRTYETPFPPFPLTSMRPIVPPSDRSHGGERFR